MEASDAALPPWLAYLRDAAEVATAIKPQLTRASADAKQVPLRPRRPEEAVVQGCRKAAAQIAAAMSAYVRRVHKLQERPGDLRAVRGDGLPVVCLSAAARMTKEERKATSHAVVPERGEFKMALERRCWRGAGLAPSESYLVTYACGRPVALVDRGCIPLRLSVMHLVVREVRTLPFERTPLPDHSSSG